MMDIAAANRYLTDEERGWLKEAREEIAMDAVGLCHDVPVMLGRHAAALEALEEAQGLLRDCYDLHNWYVEGEKDGQHTEDCLGCRVDSFLRGFKEDE